MKRFTVLILLSINLVVMGQQENINNISIESRNQSINFVNQATEKIENGSVSASFPLIIEAIHADSTYHKPYDLLYKASLKSGNYSDSIISYFITAKRINDLDDEICFYIAELYRLRKNYIKAISEYTKAIELSNRFEKKSDLLMQYYSGRAYSYIKINRNEAAIADYTVYLKAFPKNANILAKRGVCYKNSGNLKLAIEDWTISAALGNSTAKAYLERIAQK